MSSINTALLVYYGEPVVEGQTKGHKEKCFMLMLFFYHY